MERKGVGVGLSVGGASYRRTKTWGLGEVKVVDGRNTTVEVTEFDLHIDKTVYKWVASNVAEKKSFISCIFKVNIIMFYEWCVCMCVCVCVCVC